jgi:hypothetical protein
MILKAWNLALGILPIIELTVSQLCIIELKSPPEIDELITIVYNTSVNLLLY